MVSLLSNPLATAEQLISRKNQRHGIPDSLERSLIWAGSSLLQSTGIILRLPQPTIATAIVLLQRFYMLMSFGSYPVLHTCHAALYLSTKLTECPAKPRSIINATSYLLKTSNISPVSRHSSSIDAHPDDYYVDERLYYAFRVRLINTEAEILKVVGFQAYTSLPYTLVVSYAQTLDCLSKEIIRIAFGYLTDGLLSPSLIYLTHQPHSLAIAALYLAAREVQIKLPERWWDVFDVEREELGFLVATMKDVEEFVKGQSDIWKAPGTGIPWEETDFGGSRNT
ncbi:cyclin-like protein [Geopyxis carbonaria]|nr:cyclin-like protein [Geopyxis carbonaria]